MEILKIMLSPALKNEREIKFYFRDTYSETPCIKALDSVVPLPFFTLRNGYFYKMTGHAMPVQKAAIKIFFN